MSVELQGPASTTRSKEHLDDLSGRLAALEAKLDATDVGEARAMQETSVVLKEE